MSLLPDRDDVQDTVTVEASRMESLTYWVEASHEGVFSVSVVYDSVRARRRPVGGNWRDLEPGERETADSRVVLTNRLEVSAVEFVDAPHLNASVAEVLRGVGGGVLLVFPENSISVGETWSVDFEYPLTMLSDVGRDEGVPSSQSIETSGTARLDSVVSRSNDTLAYITVAGRSNPSSSSGGVVLSGSLASTLVWSYGWQAFASVATRAVIVALVPSDQNEPETASKVRFDITTQIQVRN